MLRLLIARHGNTFDQGDTVLRVGLRTDLPLSRSGIAQAEKLGCLIRELYPDLQLSQVLVSNLKRTQQTANIALASLGIDLAYQINDLLDEVDYGPDEAQPEQQVIARIGQQSLDLWESQAIVPDGWLVDPELIIQGWQDLAQDLVDQFSNKNIAHVPTVLMVTSNGVARFAPYMTGNFAQFAQEYPIKLKTGALGCFEYTSQSGWVTQFWNKK